MSHVQTPDTADSAPRPLGLEIRYGVTADGQDQVWHPEADAHCLVVGSTGTGRSNLLSLIATAAVAQGMSVNVCDPKLVELRDVHGVEKYATTPVEIEDLVRAVHALMRTRHADREANKLRHEQMHPVLVILDEFHALRGMLQRAHDDAGGTGTAPTLRMITELFALARSARIHLLVGMNRPDVEVLDNLRHRISLGRLSPIAATLMWGDPDVSADRLGQGIAPTPTGQPALVQLDELHIGVWPNAR